MTANDATHEVARVLAVTPYFAGLDPLNLETIAQVASRHEYEAGQVVFLEGEPCAGLHIVQSGWLKVVKLSPAGREQILNFLSSGDVFNTISVLIGVPNPATVIVLESATLWVIRRETMHRLLDEHPGLAKNVIQDMAQRILYLVKLVEDLSLRSVETRLARILLEQADADGIVERRRWATQAEMAARLGTVPDVLNRALRSLVEAELLEVKRHQIQILNRSALEIKASATE